MPVDDDKTLYTLSFADDQVAVAQYMMTYEPKAHRGVRKVGSECHITKTEYICIGRQQEDYIYNNGTYHQTLLPRNKNI